MEEKDFLEFQFSQLHEANLTSDELETLEAQENLLANAQEIKSALFSVTDVLDSEENSLIDALKTSIKNMDKVAEEFQPAKQYSQRLNSVLLEVKDIIDSSQQNADEIEDNPLLLEEIQERINLLNTLLQKHQKESIDDLILLRDEIDQKLSQISLDNGRISTLTSEKESLLKTLFEQAKKLSEKRKKGVPKLQKQLKQMLSELGMPNAIFIVDIKPLTKPTAFGIDDISFLFSANPDLQPSPIHKVASGGEMSRLMLCLKSVVAEYQHLPSIIFDEIDTGVSGEVAGRMGEMMKILSQKSQVFAITHLPQVAALGKEQFHVSKTTEQKQSRINITQLETNERIKEIARMSSGKNLTEIALQHAKNLLGITE